MAAMKRCLVLLVVTLGAVGPAPACLVESWAVFTDARGPDAPLDAFAGGRLGVLLPSYASAYLAVAYRHLSGHPLDDEEVRAAVGLWQRRLGSTPTPNPSDLIRPWMDARAIVAGRPYQEIRLDRQIGPGQWYTNCLADAFVRAAETLRSRAAIFGADSAGVRAWVDAQDAVFANCDGSLRLPAAPEPDLAPMLAADRAYQIAAANFYGGAFDEATARFRAIANDRASPWWEEAPYLAARSLLRKGVLASPIDREALAAARRQLEELLADQDRQARVRQLLDLVSAWLDPRAQLEELAGRLLAPAGDPMLSHDLDDYTILLQKTPDAADPLSDWIASFKTRRPEARTHIWDRWRETHTLPWLVAALAHGQADDPEVEQLLAAAAAIPASSPATPTVALHRARLLAARGRPRQARRVLDEVLAWGGRRLPGSARNLLLAARLPLASDLDTALRDVPRRAVRIANLDGGADRLFPGATRRALVDVDGADLLNRVLSVDLEAQVARDVSMPAPLRADILAAAWVRAVLLGRHNVARELAPDLGRARPALAEVLREYVDAPDPEAAAFAAALAILRRPELGPFVLPGIGVVEPGTLDRRAERWCPKDSLGRLTESSPTPLTEPVRFLNASERAAASADAAALRARPALLDGIYETVLARGQRHADDPRVPEALHRAVARTRDYRCQSDGTSRLSHAAFRLLHERYGHTAWAHQTPYWYCGDWRRRRWRCG